MTRYFLPILAGYNNVFLEEICKEWEIPGYETMNRGQLMDAILSHPNNETEAPRGD